MPLARAALTKRVRYVLGLFGPHTNEFETDLHRGTIQALSLLPLFSFYIAVVFHPVVFSSIRKMEIFFSKLFIPFIPCFSFFIFARYFRIIIPRYGNIFVKFSRLFSFNEKTFRFSFYSNRIEKWKYFVIYFPSSDSNTIKESLLFLFLMEETFITLLFKNDKTMRISATIQRKQIIYEAPPRI